MEEGYRLAYEEVVRALTQQATALEGRRTRAGLLLSAASIATSFLGGQALRGPRIGLFSWLGVMSFVALAMAVLHVLWPREERRIAMLPTNLIGIYLDDRAMSLSDTLRDLALQLERTYSALALVQDRLSYSLRLATALLLAEVGAWMVALATRVG